MVVVMETPIVQQQEKSVIQQIILVKQVIQNVQQVQIVQIHQNLFVKMVFALLNNQNVQQMQIVQILQNLFVIMVFACGASLVRVSAATLLSSSQQS